MKKVKTWGAMLLITSFGILTSVSSTSNPIIGPVIPPGKCICLDVYKPVCIIATGQQFSNACRASCAGYTPDEWVDCSTQ